ncbi:hypothetical protein EI94DRAFT_1698592 [Lactarius quietus]|nr:hypothetical protein EI94DRAFT_1698592 [Lactarius quietus]
MVSALTQALLVRIHLEHFPERGSNPARWRYNCLPPIPWLLPTSPELLVRPDTYCGLGQFHPSRPPELLLSLWDSTASDHVTYELADSARLIKGKVAVIFCRYECAYGLFFFNVFLITCLPVLDDELEGGITDDAKEWLSMECNHLSGKPLCPKVLKSHYSRSMIKSTTIFGIINAWEQPSLADLQKIWRDVFSEECILSLQTTGGVVALKLVQYDNYPQFLFDYSLLGQIDDCLLQWRKRFEEHKLEALEEITFNDLPTNDTGHQEWWCSWALTCSNGHCRTFYYAVYNEPEGSPPIIKSIFQSPLIATVLGMHMSWLSAIDEDVCSDKKPVGALIHAIQVGCTIHINTVLDLVAVIAQLKEKQWDKILNAAWASGKVKKQMMHTVSETPEPSEATLAELRDNNLDLMDEE